MNILCWSGPLPYWCARPVAFSTTSGLVRLMLDGPLADLDEASRDALTERTLDMVAKGL